MKQKVHRAEPGDALHQLDVEERAVLESLLLRLGENDAEHA